MIPGRENGQARYGMDSFRCGIPTTRFGASVGISAAQINSQNPTQDNYQNDSFYIKLSSRGICHQRLFTRRADRAY
jgi:hypothetical protein